jgi:hypothetical protein
MCRHEPSEWAVIHRSELGLKSLQGSESLFCGRVKHLLVQGIGQGRTRRLISGPDFAEKRLGWIEMPMTHGSRRLHRIRMLFCAGATLAL